MSTTKTTNLSYTLLSGIRTNKVIPIDESVELLPADTSHLDFHTAISTCSSADDIAVIAAFIPKISAQFKISAPTAKDLAIVEWNSSWNAILLSAIFHTEVGFHIRSNTHANNINKSSILRATNYHMHGSANNLCYVITDENARWIESNFPAAQKLLGNEKFTTSVHCLASYRWHTLPRVRLAVLWAGIEGMFGVNSEIRFRISIYISKFLHPNNETERKRTFNEIKKLYDIRSAAVHGSKLKEGAIKAVNQSAEILRQLIVMCIENQSLPQESDLAP